MKVFYWSLTALGLLAGAADRARADIMIPVVNPSFELPQQVPGGGGYTIGTITGWTTNNSGVYGVFYPNSAQNNLPVPDPNQVGYAGTTGSGGSFGQDVGVAVVPGDTYTLSVEVGSRLEGYPAHPLVELFAGNTLLGSFSTSIASGTGNFTPVTITATALAGASGNLVIQLSDTGPTSPGAVSQTEFDLVKLSDSPGVGITAVVPEPATLATTGLGALLGLGVLCHRRRRRPIAIQA